MRNHSVKTVQLAGTIDEHTRFEQLFGEVDGGLIVNCGEISRINSMGIRNWTQYFEKLRRDGATLRFSACSPVIVEQTGVYTNFILPHEVDSLQLPYFCGKCNKDTRHFITIQELQESQFTCPSVACQFCAGPTELDEPLNEYFSAFTTRAILLISRHPDDHVFAEEVAISSGLALLAAPDFSEAQAKLKQLKEAILLVDISSAEQFSEFSRALGPLIGEGPDQINPNSVHVISSENLENIQEYAKQKTFGHFIYRRYGDPRTAGRHYGRILQGLVNKHELALHHVLSMKGGMRVMKLQHCVEKRSIVDSIHKYLATQVSCPERIAATIATAVDELLMNAIYDAPNRAPREPEAKVVQLKPQDAPAGFAGRTSVEVHMGFDEDYIAFTVIDQFGSINRPDLFDHIFKTFDGDTLQIDTGSGGAGIGLAMTFRRAGSLIFVAKPEVKTEVTVFFRRARTYREFNQQFRFISVHLMSDRNVGPKTGTEQDDLRIAA